MAQRPARNNYNAAYCWQCARTKPTSSVTKYDIELAPRGRESERDDLFSDWDIRREQSTRESAHEDATADFQRSSDVSRNRQVDTTEDNERYTTILPQTPPWLDSTQLVLGKLHGHASLRFWAS